MDISSDCNTYKEVKFQATKGVQAFGYLWGITETNM